MRWCRYARTANAAATTSSTNRTSEITPPNGWPAETRASIVGLTKHKFSGRASERCFHVSFFFHPSSLEWLVSPGLDLGNLAAPGANPMLACAEGKEMQKHLRMKIFALLPVVCLATALTGCAAQDFAPYHQIQ